MERMNIDQIDHSLRLCGMSAYRAAILNLAAQMNELQEQVEELQSLVSAEIMGGLAKPSELREVVEELGHGWRIERQPADASATEPSTATVGQSYTWLPGDLWTQYCAAADAGPCSAQGGATVCRRKDR